MASLEELAQQALGLKPRNAAQGKSSKQPKAKETESKPRKVTSLESLGGGRHTPLGDQQVIAQATAQQGGVSEFEARRAVMSGLSMEEKLEGRKRLLEDYDSEIKAWIKSKSKEPYLPFQWGVQ